MTASHPFDRYAAWMDLGLLREYSARPLRKCVRVNTLKGSTDAFRAWAAEREWKLTPVPWAPEGLWIDRPVASPEQAPLDGPKREALGRDLLHLLGHFYMQEAASMLPPALLDPQPGEMVLDMSAAPGSKTTQMAAMMRNTGVIVANDVQEKRLWTLKAAQHRAGALNVVVTKKVGQWFGRHMTERFDRVLCDAPCTAQGTCRKDTDALRYCSPDNIAKMARLQKELLEAAVHAAKVGGRIVYSTCTLTPEENEGVIAWALERFEGKVEAVDPRSNVEYRMSNIDRAIEDSQVVQKSLDIRHSIFDIPAVRLWPQTYDTEGFFCAVLRKTARTRDPMLLDAVPSQELPLAPKHQKEILQGIEHAFGASLVHEGERLMQRGDVLLLATESAVQFPLPVQDYALGIPFAKRLKDGRIRLDHEAVTLRGQEATRSVINLSESDLAQLLDGRDITCDPALRGDMILRYRGIPVGLGLAKEGSLKNNLPRWVVQRA